MFGMQAVGYVKAVSAALLAAAMLAFAVGIAQPVPRS